MKNNAMALAPYFDYCSDLSFISNDLEFYLLNAVAKTFHFPAKEIPEIWDISDYVSDDINHNGLHWVNVGCFSYPISKREITAELIEAVLAVMKIEFIDIEGEHINDCQNILLEDW